MRSIEPFAWALVTADDRNRPQNLRKRTAKVYATYCAKGSEEQLRASRHIYLLRHESAFLSPAARLDPALTKALPGGPNERCRDDSINPIDQRGRAPGNVSVLSIVINRHEG
jgi:hypothetical protein